LYEIEAFRFLLIIDCIGTIKDGKNIDCRAA